MLHLWGRLAICGRLAIGPLVVCDTGSMPIRIVQVDAFTARPFTGNPAAVCVLQAPPTDQWMRDVAREMNLSETAFLTPHDDGYNLRWFTPAVEVDLCGHATVASAHVLWEDGHLPRGPSGALPHAQRPVAGRPPRRLDRTGFPRQSRHPRGTAAQPASSPRGASAICGPQPIRLPGGGGVRRDAARHDAGFHGPAEGARCAA